MSKPLLWFRPSPFGKIFTISIVCGFFMMLGAIVVGAGVDTSGRISPNVQPFLLLGGMMCVICAVFGACWGFYKILMNDNTLLLLSTKGIEWNTPSTNESMSWRELDSVEKSGSNILLSGEQKELRIPLHFVGTTPEKLVATISETQKKVLLGVMR
jgi:hypothetical protein